MISSWLKKYFLDILFVGLIIGGSIYAWVGVLGQMIEGEGFYYFSPTLSFILPDGRMVNLLTSYDNFPRLLYYTLEKIFVGNLQPYMWVLFTTILLINVSFYFFIKGVTGNRLVGFLGAALAGINYTSNFQFYARGHYQWFAQRVPELFPVLLSFYLTISFLDQKKWRDYFWSLALFVLAILMSHFTTLLLPFFPGIFLAAAIFKSKNIKTFLGHLLLMVPFILVNHLIVSFSSLSLSTIRPNETLLSSLFANKDIFHKISFQLTAITVPYSVFKPMIESVAKSPEAVISRLIIPVYLFYGASFFLLFKKRLKNFYVYVGIFIALLGNLFLNAYLNRIKIYNEIQQGRYYFIPSIFVGILLATFIYHWISTVKLFRRPKIMTAAFILLAFSWTRLNANLINKKIDDSQYQYTGGRLLLEKLKEEKPKWQEGVIVMLPNPLMPLGEDFLKKFYSNGNTKFLFIDTKWKERLPGDIDLKNLFVYDYNREFSKDGKVNVEQIVVVDRSEEYRSQLSP